MNCGDKYEKEKNRITTTGTATTADAENIRPVRAETTAQVHKENVDKLASYITTMIKRASTHYLSLSTDLAVCVKPMSSMRSWRTRWIGGVVCHV